MARMGSFAGPSEQYGIPLSFVHPVDNDFLKAQFNPILLDPRWKLTDKQRRELQQKADDLTGLLKEGRELSGGYDPNYAAEQRRKSDKRKAARQAKARKARQRNKRR